MPRSSAPLRLRFSTAAVVSLLVYVAGFAVVFAGILHTTRGHFTYSLDDPYIHLALAERIRHGLYGLNAGEPASPSSSIIWPFLFVPFAGTAVMAYMPLVINFAVGCGVAWLLGTLIDRALGEPSKATLRWVAAGLASLLVLGMNMLGLAFTGLEQLLELLLCLGCAYLCILAAQRRHIPTWPLVMAALLPSVRYEGVLVTAAVVVVLWSVERRRAALLVAGFSLIPLGLFSLFLVHLGLPPVPISVIIKGATVVITGGKLHGLLLIAKGAIKTGIHDPERRLLLILTVMSASLFAWNLRNRRWRVVLGVVTSVCLIQTLVGPFGWLFRYEIYSIGFVVPILLASILESTGGSLEASPRASGWQPRTGALVASFLLTFVLVWVYKSAVYATVSAARSVWREQAQLARLTHEAYQGPVAVNDLGLVAFQRDPRNYVLDLYALGSPEVFRMRAQHRFWDHLGDVTREHHIGLVAIYPEWFQSLPAEWKPIAKLCIEDADYGPAFNRVMLYSTPDSNRPELLNSLRLFQTKLARGTHLQIEPSNSDRVCR